MAARRVTGLDAVHVGAGPEARHLMHPRCSHALGHLGIHVLDEVVVQGRPLFRAPDPLRESRALGLVVVEFVVAGCDVMPDSAGDATDAEFVVVELGPFG